MRQPLAVVVAALVAAGGAVILGEYDLHGVVAVLAGAIFGVTVAEVIVTIGRNASLSAQFSAAALAGAGLAWATWISTGHAYKYATVSTWMGIVAGAVLAAVWVRSGGRRGQRSPDEPVRTPDA